MKIETFQILLNLMSKREFVLFKQVVLEKSKSDQSTKFCDYLVKNPSINETALLRYAGLTKRNKYHALEQISALLVEFLNCNKGSSKEKGFQLIAKELIQALEHRAAIPFIEEAFRLAEEKESFGDLLELNELRNSFPKDISISGRTTKWVVTQLELVAEFERLFESLSTIRQKVSTQERKKLLLEVRRRAFHLYRNKSLGKKAFLEFLKLQAKLEVIDGDLTDAVKAQEALIAHIDNSKKIGVDPEYLLAKELKILSYLYWQAGRIGEFHSASKRLWAHKFQSKKAEFEKIYQQFPFLINIAIEKGDENAGKIACSRFFDIESLYKKDLPDNFAIQSLYAVAYFHIAIGDGQTASKAIFRLARFSKSAFLPVYFLSMSLLEIISAINENEIGDAIRLIRNVGNTKFSKKFPALPKVLKLLKESAKVAENKGTRQDWEAVYAQFFSSGQIDKLELSKYFDFGTWVSSKIRGCQMIEIFDQMTAPKVELDFHI